MRAFYIFCVSSFLLACGGDDNPGAGDTGAAEADQPDTGTTPQNYPAFAIDAPQVVTLGGPVLATPKVQPVYFPGFSFPDDITSFTSKIGASKYWAPLSEYGVGAITSNPPIALTSQQIQPADIGNIADADIKAWLIARWDGTHPEFGTAPDPHTIYALFYPAQTVITLGGPPPAGDGGVADGGGGFGGSKSCTGFGGYHDDVLIGTQYIAYAVLPQCPKFGTFTGKDAVTTAASHELSEAVTDPYPTDETAYGQVDDNHIAWMFFLGGGEVGDMCAQFDTSFYTPDDLPFVVQRNWSNASAKAGHDPCVPSDGSTYFNAAPIFNDKVTTRGGLTTKGILVPVGQSKSLELDMFSDAPTNASWAVTAQVLAKGGTSTAISFAFDVTSGQNGDKLNVNVTSNTALTSSSHSATMLISSTLGQRSNLWIGTVGQQ